jgi:hypothetical protein
MALAMGGSPVALPCNKTLAVSANWGTFEGHNALAISGVGRVAEDVYLNGGIGIGANEGTSGGRAGVTYAW